MEFITMLFVGSGIITELSQIADKIRQKSTTSKFFDYIYTISCIILLFSGIPILVKCMIIMLILSFVQVILNENKKNWFSFVDNIICLGIILIIVYSNYINVLQF